MGSEYKLVEDPVCAHARKAGWLAWKFTSPNLKGVPDRVCVAPWGMVCFIEFKAPGEDVAAGSPQERRLNELAERGANVFVVNDVDAGKRLIDTFSTQDGYMQFAMNLAQQAKEELDDAQPRIITPLSDTLQ